MKSLKEYLISEKLKVNKEVKSSDYIKARIPKLEDGDWSSAEEGKIWKTIEIPFKKFVIFIDRYRFNYPHFAALSDFMITFTQFQNDYEDYTPEKIILYASDDLYETFQWYLNYLGIKSKQDIKSRKKCADHDSFFEEIFNKNWNESDFLGNKNNEPSKEDIENYDEYWCKHIK